MTTTERRPTVLIVDDKLAMAEMLADGLADHGYDAMACGSGASGVAMLGEGGTIDAIVTDLRMPGVDGMAVLAASQKLDARRPVIMMTAYGAVETAVEAIRHGAYQYLTKPFKLDELVIFLGRALDEVQVRREAVALRLTLHEQFSRAKILGTSDAMQRVFSVLDRVARTDAPVLLTGETGTGKGLFAKTLHDESLRSAGRFVTVNCAALPEQLLESELFGHVKGSFSGATSAAPGLFVEASGGTLFLDEIGEMSPRVQAKLLDVLGRGMVRPVGSAKERAVDVRVVAATNRDLRERVRVGEFREDLLYRLDVVSLSLPPLRQRREDLPPLILHFVAEMCARHPQSPLRRMSPAVLARMLDYPWPGNVRELAHTIERMVLLATAPDATLADLPHSILSFAVTPETSFGGGVLPIRELERIYAGWALRQLGGNQARTAEKLGVDRKTLAKWLSREPEG